MQEKSEIEKLIINISKDPIHWQAVKKHLFIGLLATWNQLPEEAQQVAEIFGKFIVEDIKKGEFNFFTPHENLINVFKNSILIQEKNLQFFQSILKAFNVRSYALKSHLSNYKESYEFILTLAERENPNLSKKPFMERFEKNKKILDDWLELPSSSSVNTHSDSHKEVIVEMKSGLIPLWVVCFSYTFLSLTDIGKTIAFLNYNPIFISVALGALVYCLRVYSVNLKTVVKDIEKAFMNINLELKKEYSAPKPTSKKHAATYSKTITMAEPSLLYLEMKPVSYLKITPAPPISLNKDKVPKRRKLSRVSEDTKEVSHNNTYTKIIPNFILTETQKNEGILVLDEEAHFKGFFKFGKYKDFVITSLKPDPSKKLDSKEAAFDPNTGVFKRGFVGPTGEFGGFKNLPNLKRHELKPFSGDRLEFAEKNSVDIKDEQGNVYKVPSHEPILFYKKN